MQGECGLEQTCRISLPGLKLLDFWCCWLENGINRRWAGWVWYQHIHTHVGSGAWVLKAKTSFSESEMDYLPCQPDLASCPPGRSFLQAGCVQGHPGDWYKQGRGGQARRVEERCGSPLPGGRSLIASSLCSLHFSGPSCQIHLLPSAPVCAALEL